MDTYSYRNTRTGAVITVPSPCSGGDWVPLTEPEAQAKPQSKRTAKSKEAAPK